MGFVGREISHPDWLLLAASEGRPVAQLIATNVGERTPLPVGLDESYAFDHALSRDGWVMLQVGYQVGGLRDGDLLHMTRLPDAWTVAPAADDRHVVVNRYFGRS